MGIWREIFGPSQEEVWREFSAERKYEFVRGGWTKPHKVIAWIGDWTIILDTYTVSTGKSSIAYTRLRAPLANRDGFQFKIYRRGVFSDLGKLLGMQDVEVGYPLFDQDFIIKGNNEHKLRELFANNTVREMIEGQPQISLEIKTYEGREARAYPEGTDYLKFEVVGVIKDTRRLQEFFSLLVEMLNQLHYVLEER